MPTPISPRTYRLLLWAMPLVLCISCKEQSEADRATTPIDPLFVSIDPATSGLAFTNTVENTDELNIFNYRNFYNGGGVGIIDINNDGLQDVFLTANLGPNKLFLNQGGMRFEDVSAKAGIELPNKWSTGVAVVDINADGWQDIYVANAGFLKGSDQTNSLFLNNQDGTFREAAAEFGLDNAGYTTHAAFVDYDLDGDLDVYLLNNSFIPVNNLNYSNDRERYAEDWNTKNFLKGGGDKLLRNDEGQFTDVTREAGIYGSLIGFGLGITVGDVNNDNYPDFYISNDFYERDYLYINQQDGTFSEEVEDRTQHISLASMGADMADLNNDGSAEIFVTEMLPESDYRRKTTVQFEDVNLYDLKQRRGFYHQFMHNTLQLNDGTGAFREVAQFSGVEATDWSWGALLFDADNDGLRDIFVCNGIYHNLTDQDFIEFFSDAVTRKMALTGKKEEIQTIIDKMPSQALANKMFRNTGDLAFADVTNDWGFGKQTFSNGAAYADLDNDGDLDLVVNNVNQPALLYENQAAQRGARALRVRLKGMRRNTFAIGSKVRVQTDDRIMSAELIPTRGFQSSMDYTLSFGLGDGERITSVQTTWPDGTVSTVTPPDSVGLLVIDEATVATQPNPAPAASPTTTATLLREVTDLPFAKHAEENFSDLLTEGSVIRSLAKEGPALAVADVNGDGLEDVYLGGARYQPGMLYLQTAAGGFTESPQAIFGRVAETEDTYAVFFDADGDGDQDLYVASGGNFDQPNAVFLNDKLYYNDGAGNFSPALDALPRLGLNTSVVVPFDYDADGDLDLFVGSRSLPLDYGTPAPSLLLENDGRGKFANVTTTRARQFGGLGLVTDATVVDLGTGRPELVVTTEWGAPKVLYYDGKQFVPRETGLEESSGWWYAVAPADVDGDGDTDLVLGNVGLNFYLDTSPDAPAKLWVADFDDNGTNDKIITQRIDGRDMPIVMKRDLAGQVVSIKKKSLQHAQYAEKSIQDLFSKAKLDKAFQFDAKEFASVVAYNDGKGSFTTERLPLDVQLSSVHAVLSADLDGDGQPELILAGNDGGFRPQFSRLDGSFGHVLRVGNQGLAEVPSSETGLRLRGDVRFVRPVVVGSRPHLLFAINDQLPRLFAVQNTPSTNVQ